MLQNVLQCRIENNKRTHSNIVLMPYNIVWYQYTEIARWTRTGILSVLSRSILTAAELSNSINITIRSLTEANRSCWWISWNTLLCPSLQVYSKDYYYYYYYFNNTTSNNNTWTAGKKKIRNQISFNNNSLWYLRCRTCQWSPQIYSSVLRWYWQYNLQWNELAGSERILKRDRVSSL